MAYLLEQAFQQVARRKGKAFLTFLQLFVALLIVQCVVSVYQSKNEEYNAMVNSFGSGMYNLKPSFVGDIGRGPAVGTEFVPEQLKTLTDSADGQYELYQVTRERKRIEGVQEPVMVMRMDRPLYEKLVQAMGLAESPDVLLSPALKAKWQSSVQVDALTIDPAKSAVADREMLEQMNDIYRGAAQYFVVLPTEPTQNREVQKTARDIYLQVKDGFVATKRAVLLKTIQDQGSGEWEYRYQSVLELPEQELEYVKRVSSAFLLFGVFILLISTIGLIGTNFVAFLSKRHDWALHMVYGARRRDLILIQLFQYVMLAGAAVFLSLVTSKIVLRELFTEYALDLTWAGGTTLLIVLVVGAVSLIPFLQIQQVRLVDALKQER